MSRFKYYPTAKLKEILNDPYTRDCDGKDYEQYRSEIEEVLWEREDKSNANKFMEDSMAYEAKMADEELNKPFVLEDSETILWIINNFKRLMDEGFYNIS